METIPVVCVHCGSDSNVVRNGKAPFGLQRYLCRECKNSFQTDFIYNANQPGTHDGIVDMATNGAGVRDTWRVLGINHVTVINHLENSRPHK